MHKTNTSKLPSINELTSSWKKFALITSIATLFIQLNVGFSKRLPIWVDRLPTIGEIIFYVVVSAVCYWLALQVGRWVSLIASRGTRVEEFCRPVFIWALLLASVVSVIDGFVFMVSDATFMDAGLLFKTCLLMFYLLPLASLAGLYGWLKNRHIISYGFWRFWGACYLAFAILLIAFLYRTDYYAESMATDLPLMLASAFNLLITGIAHVLYANSSVFNGYSNVKQDHPAPDFQYAPADKYHALDRNI
jgi:hypothetical protein